jgi:predicted ATPase/class 3 adenylate cyclase
VLAVSRASGENRAVSAVQPAGTVTLVFTDIAGSTRLLETLGTQAYRTAFEQHRTVVRRAFAAHRGYEVDNEGDGFFYAFSSAQAAVSAVREVMAALEAGPIRIRVGIHTGEPALDPPKYVGIDVNRAARIMGAAHGGQVLLSPLTVSLLEPGSFDLLDLGEHRLKDLRAPERLSQLGETRFPPLRSLHRTNLPVPATPFVGRETELAAVRSLLLEPDVRLVSMTGPGGTGKTRLALQAAADVSDDFPDGVFWIPLAPLRDPALVLPAIAEAVTVAQDPTGMPVDDLARELAGRRLLVFIDNVEHLLPDAADAVAAVRTVCPTVTVVVTSRERLRVPGERVYAVPAMSESDGESLFRMQAASAGVELQASAEVRTLCARLDNLPLALELAAARTVVFSPEQLLDRLAQRLDLLRAGGHVDARQETLRATIAWSHDLLDRAEQGLFRRMSVFAGSCTFESAEQIAGADPDVLQSLLDKNLLRRRDARRAARFSMLETIREFASERLAAAGEDDDVQRRHLDHYAALAENCFDETLLGNDDLELLEEEREDLRLALDVALRSDPELALSLAQWLVPLWQRGEYLEGRERLSVALARAPDAPAQARAWALRAAALLALRQSDLDVAEALGAEALALFVTLGDRRGAGWALGTLASSAMNRGDSERARQLFQQAADAHGATGDQRLEHTALSSLAMVAAAERDIPRVVSLNHELVARARREGSARSLALALNGLGASQEMAGEDEQARHAYEESAALNRQIANKPLLALTLCNLGYVTWPTAPTDALAHFRESLELAREIEDPRVIAYCLEGAARIFLERGNAAHAAGLLGAASEIRRRTGSASSPGRAATTAAFEARCRAALSTDAFARAWDEGAALDSTSAADWALRFWDDTRCDDDEEPDERPGSGRC